MSNIRDFFKKKADDATTASTSSASSISVDGKRKKKSDLSDSVFEDEQLQSQSDSDAEESPAVNKDRVKNPAKRPKRHAIRKYDESYLTYGFICSGSGDLPLPQCLLCSKVLANSSMKPAPLKTHLLTVHKNERDTSLEFFKRKKLEWKSQSKDMIEFSHSEMKTIKSSFAVAYRIAREKKAFTIAECLLKPSFAEVAKIMFGDTATPKIDAIPLSARTISRRISDMSGDVQEQLRLQLKSAGFFTLQFDESTDIAGQSILMGFVRYPHGNYINENIFCCCALPERTTSEEIFFKIDGKIKEMELEWTSVIGVCTDGAPAMRGEKSGLVKRIADVAHTDFESSHCILHREALVAKDMPRELNDTLTSAVKMINNMKMKPLQARIFAKICFEENSEHKTLLLHTEIRWLSRGRALERLFELKSELTQYLTEFMVPILAKRERAKKKAEEKGQEFTFKKLSEETFLEELHDKNWVANLAYLVDIFQSLNNLNAGMQGRDKNCFKLHEKIEGFKRKLKLWKESAAKGDFDAFPSTKIILQADKTLVDHIRPLISEHIDGLIANFDKQFPPKSDPRECYMWVIEPFMNFKEKNSLSMTEKNQLIGMSIEH